MVDFRGVRISTRCCHLLFSGGYVNYYSKHGVRSAKRISSDALGHYSFYFLFRVRRNIYSKFQLSTNMNYCYIKKNIYIYVYYILPNLYKTEIYVYLFNHLFHKHFEVFKFIQKLNKNTNYLISLTIFLFIVIFVVFKDFLNKECSYFIK